MPTAQHTFTSASVSQTQVLGRLLGTLLQPGDVVLLSGPLGAGKTAFTQGIGSGLGVRMAVNSPTFTLLKEYSGRQPLYHFDLYRLDDPAEVYDLGFEEYFTGAGVSVVEWAERGTIEGEPPPWGETWLEMRIEPQPEGQRTFACRAQGERAVRLLAAFAEAARNLEVSTAVGEGREGV